MKILVAQKGAREHFLVARALHQQNALAGLVTDWYAPSGVLSLLISALGRRGASALAARAPGLPGHLVHPMRLLALQSKWQERRVSRQGASYEAFNQTDAAFAQAMARRRLPPHDAFFGYSYSSLEALGAASRRGIFTVVDQIDPGATEYRLVADEMARHPEFAGPPAPFPSAHFARAREEWELADVIIVNSEWTRDAIVPEGADPAKIEILPLAYETPEQGAGSGEHGDVHRRSEVSGQWSEVSGPLRVLWLGQVNIRKGIHVLLQAARLLHRENVHFDIVGPPGIRPQAAAAAPRNVTFHGPVSRAGVAHWYQQSDLFVLPTLSDGFAITQIEAFAYGLPVIVTPNCGRVVQEGKTGLIVPAGQAEALAEAVMKFVRNPGLVAEMSPRCIEASRAFSIEAYGRTLLQILQKHMRLGP